MTIENGRYQEDTVEDILDVMIEDAKTYFDDDVVDAGSSAIRKFYRPVAERLSEAQEDIGLVLDSSQIDHAEGQALDMLCGLIGTRRRSPKRATGVSEFTRDEAAQQSYVVPEGTVVQTGGNSPIRFRTTQTKTIDTANSHIGSGGSTTSSTPETVQEYTDDITYINDVEFSASYGTADGSASAAYIEIVDVTNDVTIYSDSTTNSSVETPAIDYDVSSFEGDITFHFRAYNDDGSTSVGVNNAAITWGGQTGVTAPIEAIEGGTQGNVASDTIVNMPDPPTGVLDTTNIEDTTGGLNRETDEELRERAKGDLAEGSRASASALLRSVSSIPEVISATIFVNDTNSDGGSGNSLPAHSFELVVLGGDSQEIAQTILDTKAAGDYSYGGSAAPREEADAELSNGDSMTIQFSRPLEVEVYVDATLEVTEEYVGNEEVQNAVVDYIGGYDTSGERTIGLGINEDVVYGEIEYAIRSVEGVYDVTDLQIGSTDPPSSTSNMDLSSANVAVTDASSGDVTISTTQV